MQKTHILSLLFITTISLSAVVKGYSQSAIPEDTIKSILISDWERAKAYTADYMKAMPANKYSFKATDSVRSFAQQLLHIAQANKFFLAVANGEKPDFSARDLEKVPSAQGADSVVYFVNSGYDAIINALKTLKASELMQKATFTMDKPYTATRLSWFMKAFEHQTHHRGQTTIYLRLAGIRPPDERLF